MTCFAVRYQVHRRSDHFDDAPTREWSLEADSPEQAFEMGQRRAVAAYKDGEFVEVLRIMTYAATGELASVFDDYIPEYLDLL